MKRTELLKEIVKKQDEIIQLLSYNDAFFNVRIAVLNEEVTVLKADLKQLEELENKPLTEDDARELESKMGF